MAAARNSRPGHLDTVSYQSPSLPSLDLAPLDTPTLDLPPLDTPPLDIAPLKPPSLPHSALDCRPRDPVQLCDGQLTCHTADSSSSADRRAGARHNTETDCRCVGTVCRDSAGAGCTTGAPDTDSVLRTPASRAANHAAAGAHNGALDGDERLNEVSSSSRSGSCCSGGSCCTGGKCTGAEVADSALSARLCHLRLAADGGPASHHHRDDQGVATTSDGGGSGGGGVSGEAVPADVPSMDGAGRWGACEGVVDSAVTSARRPAPVRFPDTDAAPPGVEFVNYCDERQMAQIMQLIQRDLSEPYSIYTYRYFINNWPTLCFLAVHESEIIGAIVCKLDRLESLKRRAFVNRGYIAMLAVHSSHRKHSIGSLLVRKAIRAMAVDGADEIVLETEVTNTAALRLYEKLGFVRDKRLYRYYLNGVDALRLKLWLCPP